MVWYGMVWYGRYGRYGVLWYGMVCDGMIWYGVGMVCYGRYGMAWCAMVWYRVWIFSELSGLVS